MSRVFISYRRDDTAGHAGRLYDTLALELGKDHVFMDVDTIEIGRDFVEVIEEALDTTRVFLVLIGKAWIGARNRSRLNSPEDISAHGGTVDRRSARHSRSSVASGICRIRRTGGRPWAW